MNDITRLSAKGQIVIPKDVRDRLGWAQGHDLEVIQMGDGVMLRPVTRTQRLSIEEATRELRQIYRHEGPPIPIEKLSWSPDVDDPDMDLAVPR
ncbi:AbrB/MazE/SpoVT family DNA-binding domain-containing protein [Blastomonas sp. SL216]|uniref:AbrB/MazE/SpoVT family DNA-binding domain-containing protein n=1 Tax=Blastomonas sp. SL216 TaxID=2995169 RepID=UPI002376E724|nr:AbrB/MazE/SpoVT family DNA-binding domain-containing protein [Blastomonas sp. SL216]